MIVEEKTNIQPIKKRDLMDSSFILMVDDDPLTNYMNKKLLMHFGANFSIKTFTNALDALSVVEELNSIKNGVDEVCILLDVQMMEMDGVEFLERLKNKDLFIKTRIYLVSGSLPVSYLEQIKNYSLAGFFLKPLSHGNAMEIIMPLEPVYFS